MRQRMQGQKEDVHGNTGEICINFVLTVLWQLTLPDADNWMMVM